MQLLACCWPELHATLSPLGTHPTRSQDVRAAEVNRLVLQSGCGVWLLLEPREGGAGARPAAAASAAVN